MKSDILKQTIAEKIAESWNQQNINYSVVHGLERYPDFLGRDLDIFMDFNHLQNSIDIIETVLVEFLPVKLFSSVHKTSWGHYYIFIFRVHNNTKKSLVLEIDLIPEYHWGPAIFTRKPVPTIQKKCFKIDPWAAVIKRLLVQILGGNIEKFSRKPWELDLSTDEFKCLEKELPKFFGKELSDELLRAIISKDIFQLTELRKKLRKQIVLNSFIQNPLKFFYVSYKWFKNEIAHIFSRSCTPIIAIVGPDGVGKSTVIEKLVNILPDSLPVPQILIKHWRPGIIPSIKQLFKGGQTIDDGPVLPRRKPGRFFLFRLLYYYSDFLLGGWLIDRPAAATLKLILYDRCARDMAVDPVRYGLSSARGTKLLWKFSPKPDLVILLYDQPERIYKRKQELPVEEISRQLAVWFKLYQEKHVNALVKVDGTPDKIAEIIRGLVVEAFIKKNKPQK